MNDSRDRSSDASSDFFSPVFSRTSPRSGRGDETLPLTHDTSWIGARMSPIHSFDHEEVDDDADDDDDDEDVHLTAVYHKALHDSLEAQSFASERSSLLRTGVDPRAKIHPLWDPPTFDDEKKGSTSKSRCSPWGGNWGTAICILSGLYLSSMGFLDAYVYLGQDDGQESSSNYERKGTSAWRLPWLAPSSYSMHFMGALVPMNHYSYGFWRLFSSMLMPCSFVEWLVVVASWRLILLASPPTPWYRWSGLFLGSTFVGQLWMLAWDRNDMAGGVSWGTCAVLTSLGVLCPARRFVLHLTASVIIVLAMLQRPYSSVMGAVGSCFFAWTLSGAALIKLPSRKKAEYEISFSEQFRRWICLTAAITIMALPVLWTAI